MSTKKAPAARYFACVLSTGMRLSPLTRSALVLIPLLLCAWKIHSQRNASVQGTTQEVNRCLTIVRVAVSRRKDDKNEQEAQRFTAVGAATDGSSPFLQAARSAKSA
jgi:hypothetical protein